MKKVSEAKEYSYIGKRIPRIDALPKVTGGAKYWRDIKLPGMLTGKILRSPYAHAKIISIDTSKAEKLPGVRAVVTREDNPKTPVDFFQAMFYGRADLLALASDKVRFIGEEVAAVAADNEDIAEEALELIDVKYEKLEAVFDPEEAMKPSAPLLYDGIKNNIGVRLTKEIGDVEKGFKEADYIFENEFRTQFEYHGIIETIGCICSWDVEGNLTIWTPNQTPHIAQWLFRTILGIPTNKVRFVCPYVGGAFGARAVICPYQVIGAILAKKAGKPVKVEFSRGEDLAHACVAPSFIIRLKTGVKKNGKFTARQIQGIGDCGAHPYYSIYQLHCGVVRMGCNLYKIPNLKYDEIAVYTNNPVRPVAYRAFGNPQMAWAIESEADIIADKLGMDPIELKLKNLFEPGEITPLGWGFASYGLPECIKKAAEATNWSEKRKEKVPNRGIGMACVIHSSADKASFGPVSTDSVTLIGSEDGSFTLYIDQSELGGGLQTVVQQIVAEILGTRLEDIKVVGGDTAITPFGMGSYGSRSSFHCGNAVKIAATDMRSQLFEVAATMLKVRTEDLEAKDRQIYVEKTPEKKVPIAEVAGYTHFVLSKVLLSKGIYSMPSSLEDPSTGIWSPPGTGFCTSYPFGCQVAEVEVDPKTGKVKVLSIVAAYDCGYPLNVNNVEGQIEGGVGMACGYGLTENLRTDEGRVLVGDFVDYFMLRAPDMPKIKPIIVITNDPYGPFGAKGIGEAVTVPTAPAIANAIYNAVGVRIRELPLTPEKILKALKEKR